MTEPAPRGLDAALAEIRAAEAARMLGVLDPQTLPELASRWLADGLASDGILDLARSAAVGDDRLRMLAAIARASGTTFPDLASARAAHIDGVITSPGSATHSADVFALSNSFTDEFTTRLRAGLSRLLARRRDS